MKLKNIFNYAVVAALGFSAVSCEDFLDRAAEDNYNTGNFYQNDEQCYQGVNYLYNSPWYDFQRGFIKVGEVFSGNMYWGSSPYLTFTVNGTDTDLVNMSYSLWSVIGHANTVYKNLGGAKGSEKVINACKGECLTMKALAYFYLVRSFGEVPIVHDNAAEINAGTYNDKYKVRREDVYEYIIMTLEQAMKLLPEQASQAGRIDYYCAEALLAKVYLTKAGLGQSGNRNAEDLKKAAEYAGDVCNNSGRNLLANYSDVFRLENNASEESLIAWRWKAGREPWTQQNTLQSDLALTGFDEFGDCWGGWGGPSVDLADAFGVNALENPSMRSDADTRRKATMMMVGDVYEYFWKDKGGFDLLKFVYDKDEYGKGGPGGTWQCPTGCQNVKHLYGNTKDHESAIGVTPDNMANELATHVLRLSDVYLIYAEALLGNNASTTDDEALKFFNLVRTRAGVTPKTSLTFQDIWKERRLELAGEGDRWYDFVRLSYYNPAAAIAEIKAQRRNTYTGYDEVAKNYYTNGKWVVNAKNTYYDTSVAAPEITESKFTLPFPSEDVVNNPHLLEPAISVDVRSQYAY